MSRACARLIFPWSLFKVTARGAGLLQCIISLTWLRPWRVFSLFLIHRAHWFLSSAERKKTKFGKFSAQECSRVKLMDSDLPWSMRSYKIIESSSGLPTSESTFFMLAHARYTCYIALLLPYTRTHVHMHTTHAGHGTSEVKRQVLRACIRVQHVLILRFSCMFFFTCPH